VADVGDVFAMISDLQKEFGELALKTTDKRVISEGVPLELSVPGVAKLQEAMRDHDVDDVIFEENLAEPEVSGLMQVR
jgi:hypothetical protein